MPGVLGGGSSSGNEPVAVVTGKKESGRFWGHLQLEVKEEAPVTERAKAPSEDWGVFLPASLFPYPAWPLVHSRGSGRWLYWVSGGHWGRS